MDYSIVLKKDFYGIIYKTRKDGNFFDGRNEEGIGVFKEKVFKDLKICLFFFPYRFNFDYLLKINAKREISITFFSFLLLNIHLTPEIYLSSYKIRGGYEVEVELGIKRKNRVEVLYILKRTPENSISDYERYLNLLGLKIIYNIPLRCK